MKVSSFLEEAEAEIAGAVQKIADARQALRDVDVLAERASAGLQGGDPENPTPEEANEPIAADAIAFCRSARAKCDELRDALKGAMST